MKNIKDRINSQLFKAQEVELSAEKVELGLSQDLKKSYAAVQSQLDKVAKERLKIIGARNKMAASIDSVESSISDVKKIVKDYESALKDLGIDNEPGILQNVKNAIGKAEKSISKDRTEFL